MSNLNHARGLGMIRLFLATGAESACKGLGASAVWPILIGG